MKNINLILFWLFLTLFCQNQSYSCEKVGIIEDCFFTSPDAIVTVRELMNHKDDYIAIIDSTRNTETRTISITPFTQYTWKYNDAKLYCQQEIIGTILCGTRKLTKSLLKEQIFPHTLIKTFEDKDREPQPDSPVTVYKYEDYQRIDSTIFRLKKDPVAELKVIEIRKAASDVSQCTKEWTITSKWERKLRHSRRHYSAEDVYLQTIMHPLATIAEGDIKTVIYDKEHINDKVVKETFVKKELKFKCFEAESPECGTNGGNLPNGSVLI